VNLLTNPQNKGLGFGWNTQKLIFDSYTAIVMLPELSCMHLNYFAHFDQGGHQVPRQLDNAYSGYR